MQMNKLDIEKMVSEAPIPCPTSPFVDATIGGARAEFGKPQWTTWKPRLSRQFYEATAINEKMDPPSKPLGFVGQWFSCVRMPSGDVVVAYVNLPGLEAGIVFPSDKFNIGTESVNADTPPKELELLIERGYEKLAEMVDFESGELKQGIARG